MPRRFSTHRCVAPPRGSATLAVSGPSSSWERNSLQLLAALMERVAAVLRHLALGEAAPGSHGHHACCATPPAVSTISSCPTAAPAAPNPKLLTDAQVREFITRGVLTLPVSELSDDFHAEIHSEAERMFSKGIALGNDIFPAISGLKDVLESPTVSGALTSLLGPRYALHPHRHMHQSTTQGDQTFHKDSQRGKVKGFRPRWVMALYVPAGATDQMGATAVVPQSQYLANDGLGLSFTEEWPGGCHLTGSSPNDPTPLAPFLREEKCITPLRQGSVTLMHYDMVHRGTARAIEEHLDSVPFRPMFKFQFLRTVDPGTSPSWDHDLSPSAIAALPSFEELAGAELAPVCQSVWEWMLGNQAPEKPLLLRDDQLEAMRADLMRKGPGAEAQRVHAAFQLARDGWLNAGHAAHEPLLNALTDETFEAGMRAAMHALGCGGDAVVPTLIQHGLSHSSPLVAGRAAEALGEAAQSPTSDVVAALCELAGRMQLEIDQLPPTVDWEGGSNFLLETFQLPLLPQVQREAAARWVTIAACVDALAVVGQRAVAQNRGALCAELATILLGFIDSVAPPVRHAAAVGLQCVAAAPDVKLQAPALLPKLLVACDDRSVVMDHCARAPATDAVTTLVGGRWSGNKSVVLESLVASRYTA